MIAALRTFASRFVYTQNTIRYRVEWLRIREALRLAGPIEHLFDGGAGSGEFARKALADGLCKRVTALEFDPCNYKVLEAKLGGRSDVTISKGSILEIPYESAVFDIAQCTQVLEHIEEHERAAAELVRVVKPGGHLLVTVPHPPEPFPNEGHVREGYTEESLRELFEPLGCRPVTVDYFLTRPTIDRVLFAERLPARGCYVPLQWIDQETGTTMQERREAVPFGILMLFQKEA